MIDFIVTPVIFLLALSVLIAVHEFGHFWVARRMGIKVLRFSIGFGKPLWTWHRKGDDTEYAISAVPLGGYVKMLDEREEEVAPEEVAHAFNRQPIAKRFAVVAAGPIFNLLFAVVAFWGMFIHGTIGMRSVVGDLPHNGLAYEAGLRTGQEVLSIGSSDTPTWDAVLEAMLPYALRKEAVTVVTRQDGTEHSYKLRLDDLSGEIDTASFSKQIGLVPYDPPLPPVIDRIQDNSAAQRAGLKPGDKVVAIDGTGIDDWEQLVEHVQASPGKMLQFQVQRNGRLLQLSIEPAPVKSKSGTIGLIGATVRVDESLAAQFRANWKLSPLAAFPAAVKKTWDMSVLTLQMFGEMIVGNASVQNISGPITIAIYAKASAFAGLSQFLGFLAIVSISLGVLNLMPIPVLDGGHLMFYVVESITGRTVSERTEAVATKIGLAVIFALMSIALYNDMGRLLRGG